MAAVAAAVVAADWAVGWATGVSAVEKEGVAGVAETAVWVAKAALVESVVEEAGRAAVEVRAAEAE